MYGLGVTVGAGIYVLLGEVITRSGEFAPVSFLIAGFVMPLPAACFAELTGRMPYAAAEAHFVGTGFKSPKLFLLVGLAVAMVGLVSSAAIAHGAVGYLSQLIDWPVTWLLILVIISTGLISGVEIRNSIAMAGLLTLIEVGGLLSIVMGSIWAGNDLGVQVIKALPTSMSPVMWSGIAASSLLAFFALLSGNASLVMGNLFGVITMNTAILAVIDFFIVRHALTSWPRKPNHALLAVLLIVMLAMLLAVTFTGDVVLILNIGLAAILLSACYPIVIALLRKFDSKDTWAPVDLPEDSEHEVGILLNDNHLENTSTRSLILYSVMTSLVILIAGVALAISADSIAEKTALGSSFVGITLLASATSLPELSTTLAAARIGAYTMAISNVFGSNLIMVALILPSDMAYRDGPILSQADPIAQFSIAIGIVVTAIYVVGILIRRTPTWLAAGLDSWLVILVFLGMFTSLYHFQ